MGVFGAHGVPSPGLRLIGRGSPLLPQQRAVPSPLIPHECPPTAAGMVVKAPDGAPHEIAQPLIPQPLSAFFSEAGQSHINAQANLVCGILEIRVARWASGLLGARTEPRTCPRWPGALGVLMALAAMVLAGLVAGSASAQAPPPNSSPEFPATETGNRGVDENTGPGQNVGTPVAATDPDGDTLTYTLGGSDADAFDIVRSSGQLQTRAALDYETTNSYSVTVTATDTPGLSADIADIDVTIAVTNVDEAATVPFMLSTTSRTL